MWEVSGLVTQTALAIRDADELEVAASLLDAALRAAKVEGLREGARLARWHAVCAFEAHPAAALERAATDIESVAKQLLDARAVQIEDGDE